MGIDEMYGLLLFLLVLYIIVCLVGFWVLLFYFFFLLFLLLFTFICAFGLDSDSIGFWVVFRKVFNFLGTRIEFGSRVMGF